MSTGAFRRLSGPMEKVFSMVAASRGDPLRGSPFPPRPLLLAAALGDGCGASKGLTGSLQRAFQHMVQLTELRGEHASTLDSWHSAGGCCGRCSAALQGSSRV